MDNNKYGQADMALVERNLEYMTDALNLLAEAHWRGQCRHTNAVERRMQAEVFEDVALRIGELFRRMGVEVVSGNFVSPGEP